MSRPPSIVIVDDSPEVRTLVRAQIRSRGQLDVIGEGANGLDAAALANRHRPDLMLLDVSMPVIDGLAALPKVLDASPGTRVVMYTGFAEAGLAERATELGASAFVEKSTPFDSLHTTLLNLVSPEDSASLGDESATLDPVLEEHLERFREVFEDAAIGMATLTLSGRLVRANRSMAQLLDRPVEKLVGVTLAELTEDEQAVEDAFQRLDAGESIVQVEHGMRDRGDRTFRSLLSPVIDARGRPLYIFLQMQDVSRQLAAEAELRQSEARFRMLVETVEDYAIFMLDPTGHISSWNAGAQRSQGYEADEIIGRHFRVFYPPEAQQSGHPEFELEEALRTGAYEEEGWRVRKDGTRYWASVTITAVHDPDGDLVGFAKVTRDITERREMLQRLEEANQQQAEFFAVTAHELRTPISVLTSASTTLTRHLDDLDTEDRADLLGAVQRSSEQLGRLLDDLLTASRLQARRLALEPTVVDLGTHLAAVVGALRQASPDTEMQVDVEPGLTVLADPVRLTQMVDNLLVNALRHGQPPIRVVARAVDGRVDVVVHDAGPGVSDELQDRLFERFATGTSRGTGLGLFLVRELARAHGGEARYRPDDGAFVVSLPQARR